MFVPNRPKIYHIVHVDRLESIVSNGYLWSDAEARMQGIGGTTIGMTSIKQYRLTRPIKSHVNLKVGDCVPFYFCPRSVMLYVIYRRDHPELQYRGGQRPIVHLEADMHEVVDWAKSSGKRWAFTTSNAGSYYFEDFSELGQLKMINWEAIAARNWSGDRKGPKQAEFLIEDSFPWHLVSRIGVRSRTIYVRVQNVLSGRRHRPRLEIRPGWYY
jgi:hypothetical protein